MRKIKYTVKATTQFKKDYKLAMKRGRNMGLLEDIVTALATGMPLPEKNRDHALTVYIPTHSNSISSVFS